MIYNYITNVFKYIFFLFINIIKKKQFIIITPGIYGILFNKILIFDMKNKIFFNIKIRNYFDIVTTFEIFGYDTYSLKNFKINKKINEIENNIKKKDHKSLIIDCGANIGCSSLYFNKTYNNSKIINIEPDESNFKILNQNCNSSSYQNICSAVSSKSMGFEITATAQDNRAFQIKENSNSDKKSITINQILEKLDKSYQPFLIKFDVEGFEKNIFSENIEWIKKFKIIIIEIHDWMLPEEECSSNFFKAINELKKDILINGENIIVINYNYLEN